MKTIFTAMVMVFSAAASVTAHAREVNNETCSAEFLKSPAAAACDIRMVYGNPDNGYCNIHVRCQTDGQAQPVLTGILAPVFEVSRTKYIHGQLH